ncbi:MAG: hypothetical protein R3294_08650 [Arenibacter troitsensis]|nr:hypothetical protein [Arenibacter troitsensis]
MEKDEKKKLLSSKRYGRIGKDGFIYRACMKNQRIPINTIGL